MEAAISVLQGALSHRHRVGVHELNNQSVGLILNNRICRLRCLQGAVDGIIPFIFLVTCDRAQPDLASLHQALHKTPPHDVTSPTSYIRHPPGFSFLSVMLLLWFSFVADFSVFFLQILQNLVLQEMFTSSEYKGVRRQTVELTYLLQTAKIPRENFSSVKA